MLVGVTWGWSQMTEPFPGKVDAPICVDTSYAAGDELFVQDVTVSVLNASGREGLAGRTLPQLEDAGFARRPDRQRPDGHDAHHAGRDLGQRPGEPGRQAGPRAGSARCRSAPTSSSPAGGSRSWSATSFGELQDGPTSVILDADAVVCSPPVE